MSHGNDLEDLDQEHHRAAFWAGRELLNAGDSPGALPHLREAFEADSEHAQTRSYYGLCIGLEEQSYREALDLCMSAVRREFFNPDLYVNVARLNIAFGFKAEGMRFLRRAQMIDPANAAVGVLRTELGLRRPPVLGFLRRGHALNRLLGSARSALVG